MSTVIVEVPVVPPVSEAKVEVFQSLEIDCQGRILAYLAQNHGRVVSKEELTTVLYGNAEGPASNCIEVFVSRIRRRRLAPGETIRTERAEGYVYTHQFQQG